MESPGKVTLSLFVGTVDFIDKIAEDSSIGKPKKGDLTGYYGYDIFYNKTNYELAYTIKYEDDKIIVVVMAGTRENFYEELKRYMK